MSDRKDEKLVSSVLGFQGARKLREGEVIISKD